MAFQAVNNFPLEAFLAEKWYLTVSATPVRKCFVLDFVFLLNESYNSLRMTWITPLYFSNQVVTAGKILTPTGGMRWKLKKMAQFPSSLGRTRSRCIAFCGSKPSLIATVTLYEDFFSCCLMKCDLPQPAVMKLTHICYKTYISTILQHKSLTCCSINYLYTFKSPNYCLLMAYPLNLFPHAWYIWNLDRSNRANNNCKKWWTILWKTSTWMQELPIVFV